MFAMVLEEPHKRLMPRELADPTPGPRQLLLEVRACAVCRTDLHVCDGELTEPKLPLIPGHEIVGTVIKVGQDVTGFRIGDRVGVPWLGSTCGHCEFCQRNQENLCDNARFTGYQIDGGYAERTVADERFCFRIPESFSDIEAAPLLCAGLIGYRSLRMADRPRKLGIFGFGAAAHIVTQVVRFEGGEVFAFTSTGDKQAQQFAKSLGAKWAGDSNTMPPEKLDAAIIFAPVGPLVPRALQAVRKGGIVVCGGIHMSDIPSFPYSLLWEERVIRSVANLTRRDAEEFLALAPKIPVRTHTQAFPLYEANLALDRLRSGQLTGAAVLVPGFEHQSNTKSSYQKANATHPAWLEALKKPETYPHPVSQIHTSETHISWIILTGEWVYKFKKPVDFGFVNFSTLERRLTACRDELQLNKRTAPDLYDSVVTLTNDAAGARINGDGPILEYAVRIKQFPEEDLFSERLAKKTLPADAMESLGREVADFHNRVEAATVASPFGSPDSIRTPVVECFKHLRSSDAAEQFRSKLEAIETWMSDESNRLQNLFVDRKQNGRVRECHGDLHLGNIVFLDDVPTLFDCLEFNPSLRWIDVASDIAFLMMDLSSHGSIVCSWKFLNAWLEETGDFGALRVLRYYFIYRALVRAKVTLLRIGQLPKSSDQRAPELKRMGEYIDLAHGQIESEQPKMIMMHGLSGSGKSVLANRIACEVGGVRIRSDVERKRIFSERKLSAEDLYSPYSISLTYQRLHVLARQIVVAGYSVIVDATFLRRADRSQFIALAQELRIPVAIAVCTAPDATLLQRIEQRRSTENDPSDADSAVLQKQQAALEPLDEFESKIALFLDSVSGNPDDLIKSLEQFPHGSRPSAHETAIAE